MYTLQALTIQSIPITAQDRTPDCIASMHIWAHSRIWNRLQAASDAVAETTETRSNADTVPMWTAPAARFSQVTLMISISTKSKRVSSPWTVTQFTSNNQTYVLWFKAQAFQLDILELAVAFLAILLPHESLLEVPGSGSSADCATLLGSIDHAAIVWNMFHCGLAPLVPLKDRDGERERGFQRKPEAARATHFTPNRSPPWLLLRASQVPGPGSRRGRRSLWDKKQGMEHGELRSLTLISLLGSGHLLFCYLQYVLPQRWGWWTVIDFAATLLILRAQAVPMVKPKLARRLREL